MRANAMLKMTPNTCQPNLTISTSVAPGPNAERQITQRETLKDVPQL